MFTAEKENSICFNFLEEKIREESRRLIESIYEDEVQQFMNRMDSIVDEKGKRLVVRNGYHKERVIQTACGNVKVRLPRIDDRADGVYVKSRLDGEKTCLLVIMGFGVGGKKELLAIEPGIRESAQSWREVLLDLKFRGLEKPLKLAICDGALGFQNAVDEIWGRMKIQRCWFHKTANILDKMPKCVQKKATEMIRDMHMADTRENVLKAYDKFVETFEAKYEKAVENLKKDKEDLFRFYDYPAEHRTHIRTSNPIESTFAKVRLRHNSTKGNGTVKATEAMAFKLCQQAEKGWRRLKGFEKLELVVKDKKFENGVLKEAA